MTRSAAGLSLALTLASSLAAGRLHAQPAPESPLSVLAIVEQARAQETASKWQEAAALWDRSVRLDPVQPAYWYSLGSARYRAGEYADAIPALEKAAELGAPLMGPSFAVYDVARCRALRGEKELAIAALERAMAMGYPSLAQAAADPDLATLRDDPKVRKLLGLADTSKMTRDEGWRYDLSVLAGEVRRKGFIVHRDVGREAFDAKVRELDEAIPKLSEAQVVLELMKLMVFLGDGHTAVWTVGRNSIFSTALPLRLFWFEEGLFVTAADPKLKELLGAQVLAFDGRPAVEVLEATAPYLNRDRGNPIATKTRSVYFVRNPKLLHALGLVRSPDRVTLSVRDTSGATRDVAVEADDSEPDIWNKLPCPPSWVTFASTLENPPLYLTNMDKAQWFEYLEPQKTVYFGFNKVLDGRREPLERFTQRLMQFIDENEVEKLVVDMRWNNGGNTFLVPPLLHALIADRKVNRPGRLYVIIGRRTYSAAQNTATYLERYTNAIFVGEPTGSCPNFVGEEVPVTLPYSQVMANVSHLYWQSTWPMDQRIWLAPQVYVPPTFADFRVGRDAALEAILAAPAR